MPDICKFRRQLEEQKRALEDKIGSFEDEFRASLREAVSELSGYDNHPADLGSETFERAKDNTLSGNYKTILGKVNDALRKIDEGTYGTCELCGRPIDEERLKAVPYSTYCIDCKRKEEESQINTRRPLEEDVLGTPFARSFLDGSDQNMYDGEDAWQDVARYGTSESPQDVSGAVSYNDIYSDEGRGIVDRADMIIYEEDTDEDDKNELGR